MSWTRTLLIGLVLGALLGFGSYTVLCKIGAEVLVEQATEQSTVVITISEGMQPFGESLEDEWTPALELQPTYNDHLQVTRHGLFMQNATADIQ